MSFMISKSDDKNQTVITINGRGIFLQELQMKLGNGAIRPKSQRVKLGDVVMIQGDIEPSFSDWDEYDALVASVFTTEKKLNAAKSIKDDLSKKTQNAETKKSVANIDAEIKKLTDELTKLQSEIETNPLHTLTSLNAATQAAIMKLIGKESEKSRVKVRAQLLKSKDAIVEFTSMPNRDYFIRKQAEDLMKRTNEALEKSGVETGYMDLDEALEKIEKRFSKTAKTTAK